MAAHGSDRIVLNEEDLRLFARLLLHVARQARDETSGQALVALTQVGISTALSTNQGTVSRALSKLVDGGALAVELAHVPGSTRRLKVYRLSLQGESIVRHIKNSMG